MPDLVINETRLMQRLLDLGAIGSTGDGGCCRLALTDEDRNGRDAVVSWMRDLGLQVEVDAIGNVFGTWQIGLGSPVMIGSHIDTVRTGGIYDGNLGVLSGLEVIQTLQENSVTPKRPLTVGVFTDEEGARFAPDMLGSLVYVGGLQLEDALDTVSIDGCILKNELDRIGYSGSKQVPGPAPHAFIEYHIEQGPVLEEQHIPIGVVTGVQGISWQEISITGQSNHAGTTPMRLRHDPAYAASAIAVFLRDLASQYGGNQVCTVGKIDLFPNLVNVVPARAVLTADIRNTDSSLLAKAETELSTFLEKLAVDEGVEIRTRELARFEPVDFHPQIQELIAETAKEFNLATMRLPSGAGHDAQMFARICPSAMIFTQSHKGISHNPREFTDSTLITQGANVLLHTVMKLTELNFN